MKTEKKIVSKCEKRCCEVRRTKINGLNKMKRLGERKDSVEERRREPDSSRTEGYAAMMSPHAGTVGLRNGLAI